MKKIALTLMLLLAFSVSGFAAGDGTTHSGGISCPEGEVCRTAPPPVEPDKWESEIFDYKYIMDFLSSIFG